MVIQWEYIVRTIGNEVPNSLYVTDKLNEYGKLGYELVGIHTFNIKGKLTALAIFKKPCGKTYFDARIK